ncbi:hypothetical protein BJ508DRAFT_27455 [Ascobolus immersus RN42]|uniref:Uncharacterized protein n=1 Tax=Ascobolus immersus RN42 TaxID=1160509 RepID=A0A3N4IL12_ASCIM|nr:hypothetical protein BJ508DRAFT_27455 [Ascobolus immersus RN42]
MAPAHRSQSLFLVFSVLFLIVQPSTLWFHTNNSNAPTVSLIFLSSNNFQPFVMLSFGWFCWRLTGL